MIRTMAVAALLGLAALPAAADETWKTSAGTVEWETDAPGAAVFKLALPQGKLVRFYVEGLTAETKERGTYTGYFISTDDKNLCGAQLVGPDGTKSRSWGRIELTFLKPGFPSDWVMRSGDCFAPLSRHMSGFTPAE